MTINVLNLKEFPAILKLLKTTGGKYVIVEDGKPSFVMMSMDEYNKLLKGRKASESSEKNLIDKINKDIAEWRAGEDERMDYSDLEAGLDESKKDDFEVDDLSYYYDV